MLFRRILRRNDRVEDAHLSLEMLAKWLSGSMEHDEVLSLVVPHFLAQCPMCRERHQEILRLQREVGHWDEQVAVLEGQEAPDLWMQLVEHSYEEQVRRADEDESFHTWGLCQLLLDKSLKAGFGDPRTAVDLANLAIKVAAHLGDAYDPSWVLDLRARAFAYLGNARRILGELRSAEDAFHKAEKCLDRSTSGNTLILAEILDLKGSLRRAQRRFHAALELVEQSATLYREIGDPHGAGIALLKKAQVLSEMGDLTQAIQLLRDSTPPIDPILEPRLFTYARYNLLGCLVLAGRSDEADKLLPEVRNLFQGSAQPLDLVRLRWTEGNIALGLGRLGPAEAAFREVQRDFLERRMGYDAALVSLDLAHLYAREGCRDDLKRLAAELVPIFESRDVHREALVTLLMFQRACEEERLTVEMIQEMAAYLRRERGLAGG
jgi:tetratricopeptide (TPR) repeat protein